jgi:hypothetical protein
MFKKLKRIRAAYREVPTSYYDLSPNEQMEWVEEFLKSMAPTLRPRRDEEAK